MISSVSGMESFLAMISGQEGLKAAADGFQDSFLKEVRSKGMKAEMTFARDLKSNGYLGQEFSLVMGEIDGIVRVFITKKKIYAVLVLNALKGDLRVERFLDSFTLKEAAVAAGTENKTTPPTIVAGPVVNIPLSTNAGIDPPPAASTNSQQPIRGGVLNGKAISLPKPAYPAEARRAGASGTVTVQITVDEQGDVISARAISGHPSLQDAAVAAASRAKFSPTRLSGQPVKVTGMVTYNFVIE